MLSKAFSKVLAILLVVSLVVTFNSGLSLSAWATEEQAQTEEAQTVIEEVNDKAPQEEDISVQEDKEDPDTGDVLEEEAVEDEPDGSPAVKTEYVYRDKSIRVTATLSDASSVPDNAELIVTPVTPQTKGYNYDTYMAALNKEAAKSIYTGDNTFLYDIAFIIKEDGSRIEVQPEKGTVAIKAEFLSKQLTEALGAKDADDVQLIHLPLDESVADSVDTTAEATDIKVSDVEIESIAADVAVGKTESAEFSLDGFSILAISSNPDKFGSTDQDNSQVNHLLALGRAVEYGIVADTYVQTNHQQTNFAVKKYKNQYGNNGEPDLAGTWDVPYQIGEITQNKLRFGTSTYQSSEVQYDVYLPKSYEQNINNYVQIDGGGRETVNIIYEDESTIKNNVGSMLSGAESKSDILASHPTTITLTNDVVRDQNQLVVDTTNYPDNAVIYLNIPDTADYSMIRTVLGMQASFHLHKKENQVIVINVLGSSNVNLNKLIVTLPGEDINTKDDQFSTFSPSGQNSPINERIDKQIAQKVIWNIPDAAKVTLNTAGGIFLVPKGDVDVVGTSVGWIVSGGTVTTDGCEFHYVYTDRHYTPQSMSDEPSRDLSFTAYKGLKDAKGNEIGLNGRTFPFSLYETGESFDTTGSQPIETVQSSELATANFSPIQFTESDIANHTNGDYYYVIKEDNPGSTESGVTNWDGQINVILHAEVEDGNVVFKLRYYRYQSSADMEQGNPENNVRDIDVAGEEFTFGRVFNRYEAKKSVSLGAQKLLDGDAPEEGAFEFTLTEVADEEGTEIVPKEGEQVYTDSASNDAEGNILFNEIEYSASDAGTSPDGQKHYYKIVETSKNNTSIDYDNSEYIVTVTVKDDGNGNITAEADKTANQIVFKNSTKTGALELKKTIKGDITEEEAEGALKFEVTTGEGESKKWLDKDGSLSDSKVELTLKDFTHTEGKDDYVLTIEKVPVGEYSVTETTKDVSGKDVSVSYTIGEGEAQTGDSAAATVTKDQKTEVAFEDNYTNQTGSFELKKTVGGDVTKEEIEKAAITFEVTTTVKGEDGSDVTKWLDKSGKLVDEKTLITLGTGDGFTSDEDGKVWTKTFASVPAGEYTVKEENSEIKGHTLKESSTTEATATVVAGAEEAAKAELTDEYEKNPTTGPFELKKTVGGDVTKEEIEKAAITFEVTTTVKGEDGSDVTKWLDKSGKLVDEKTLITLGTGDGFTSDEDGKVWTKTFASVPAGEYTVKEENSEIKGHTLKESSTTEATATVVAGAEEAAKAELTDEYEKNPTTGPFELKKTVGGDVTKEEIEKAAITFEVTTTVKGEDGKDVTKWLDKSGKLVDEKTLITLGTGDGFTSDEDGKVWTKTFASVPAGEYTVKEENSAIAGYTLDEENSTTEAEATVVAGAEEAAKAELTDEYTKETEPEKKGDLIIKKTVGGDVTEEELAEAAITFEVTTTVKGEDGKDVTKWLDKDGKVSDTKVELTLGEEDGFVTEDGGKTWTKSFKDVPVGEYTVTETNALIEGYTLDKENSTTETTAEVKDGESATAELTDEYTKETEPEKKGDLIIKKTVGGDVTEEELAEAAITFEVTTTVKGEDGKDVTKWLDKDGKVSDTKVELTLGEEDGFVTEDGGKTWTKSFKDVPVGEYTVTETNALIEGYTLDEENSTTEAEATVVAGAEEAAKAELTDEYTKETEPEKKGDLIIKKTVGGDVTEEELAEAAITFEVKTSDGKWLDKDGKVSDTKVELTLGEEDGFVTEDGGKTWTKSFKDVPVGEYTVTETNALIEGYTLDKENSTTETTAEVKDGESATAELTDEYTKETEPEKKGDLIIKKTVGGDVTEEELAEAAITFEVTTTVKGEDGKDVTKWLDKDGKVSDTKVELTLGEEDGFVTEDGGKTWTKSFKDVPVGEYTVTETNALIEGYTLDEENSTTEAEATVVAGAEEAAKAELTDEYTKETEPEKKGDLIIKKTVGGDVTEEELAEAAITFEVTTTVKGEDGKDVTKWLDKDGKVSDTKVELTLGEEDGFVTEDGGKTWTKSFKDVPVGEYTVTETNALIEGYTLDEENSTTEATAEVKDGESATAELTDEYTKETEPEKKGDLIIKKTVGGDVTEEELAEAAITFEVTTGEGESKKWLDKDGKVSDTKVELTLGEEDGFVTEDGGKTWTKSFKDVPVGEYTVTETNALIEGYTLDEENSTTEATAEVKDGESATAELTDEYTKKPGTGSLELKKTIGGDVTKEEIENAAITFEVTTTVKDKDGKEVTKWLDKNGKLVDEKTVITLGPEDGFTSDEEGKVWTKTFEEIPEGTYNVKEVKNSIDGYTLEEDKSTTETNTTVEVGEGKVAKAELIGEYTKTPDTDSEQTDDGDDDGDDDSAQADDNPSQDDGNSDQKDKNSSEDKGSSRGVGTGDETLLGAWLIMMTASLLGLVAIAIYRRRIH